MPPARWRSAQPDTSHGQQSQNGACLALNEDVEQAPVIGLEERSELTRITFQ